MDKGAFQIAVLMVFCIVTFEGALAASRSPGRVYRSVEIIKPSAFLNTIFAKYGGNGSMDLTNFKGLLNELKIGGKDGTPITKSGDVAKECLSAVSILDVFSINKTSLDEQDFQKVCPAIVQQLEGKTCEETKTTTTSSNSRTEAWGYGFLSVAIISCASLVGAFVVPFMSQAFYKTLLLFMVSLAVGVLSGSGLFHLVPHALETGHHHHNASNGPSPRLLKSLVIAGGVYLFFFLEYVMKMYIRFKDPDNAGHSHTRGHSHSQPALSKKSNGAVRSLSSSQIGDIGFAKIAETQLDLYNINEQHHGAHINSFCPNNDINGNHSNGDIMGSHSNGDINGPDGNANSVNGNCVKEVDATSSYVAMKTSDEIHRKTKQHIAPMAWMIVIGDAVHNFIDGLALGVGFSTSTIKGVSTALAIFCEELPHELGDFAVLLKGGMSYKQAMFFNFLSACSCFLGLICGLLLGYHTPAVKWIYALAGGMFLYIALVDMLQEANEMSVKEGEGSVKRNLKMFALQNFGILLGLAIMFVLAVYESAIKI